jgi:hypothetical protein
VTETRTVIRGVFQSARPLVNRENNDKITKEKTVGALIWLSQDDCRSQKRDKIPRQGAQLRTEMVTETGNFYSSCATQGKFFI